MQPNALRKMEAPQSTVVTPNFASNATTKLGQIRSIDPTKPAGGGLQTELAGALGLGLPESIMQVEAEEPRRWR